MLKPLSSLKQAERQLAHALSPLQRSGRRLEPVNPPPSSLADLGVSVSEENAAVLRDWRNTSRSSVGSESNATFVDGTCIETARMLIDGRYYTVGPLSLLDLSTFVTAYCLFDRIAFLHNEMFAATELRRTFHDNVFIELPVQTTGQLEKRTVVIDARPALYDVYLHTVLPRLEMLYLREPPGLAKAVHDGWRTLLGADPGNPGRQLDRQIPFAAQGSQSAGTPDLDQLSCELTQDTRGDQHDLEGYAIDPKTWREDRLRVPVAESNARSIFNLAIGELLRLPYSCSAGRLPYRRYLYQQAKRRDAGMAKRIARSSPEAVRLIEQNYDSFLGRVDTTTYLNLPPFLAAVLARVAHASEIPEAMAELRRQASPFRKNLDGLNACVRSGIRDEAGVRGINAMMRALQDDARLLRRNALGSAAVKGAVAVAATAIAAHTFSNSAAPWEAVLFQASPGGFNALAGLVDRDFLEKLGRRLFRREYWFLTRLGSSLRATTGGWDRVQQIWNVSSEQEEWFSRRFDDIAQLRYG